jgi:hypothetical protein
MYRLLLACEGPTDKVLVEAAVANHVGDYVVTVLQPELSSMQDQGPFGGGWKGVRRWCQQVREQGSLPHVLNSGDALIIHVDADVASDDEINCERTCPPASDTTDAVRQVVKGWLGEAELPSRAVLCVPSKATEAWALAGLFPADGLLTNIECRAKPERLFVGRTPRLVRRKGNEYR